MVIDNTGSVEGTYAFIYCIGSAKGLYACIYWKKWRFGQVLPMPDTQTTEDRATQLLYSIQFKLSHAIKQTELILYAQINLVDSSRDFGSFDQMSKLSTIKQFKKTTKIFHVVMVHPLIHIKHLIEIENSCCF